jgi:Family of unknown function (DUF5684)
MQHILFLQEPDSAALIALMMPFFIFGGIISLFLLVCHWILFQKAGRQGWECLIPIYNSYVLLKIVGKSGWWLLLYCIPLFDLIWIIWTYNMLSKSFGKDEGFTVGLVLVPYVFIPILAFGKAEYLGPYGDPAAFAAYRATKEPGFDFEQK